MISIAPMMGHTDRHFRYLLRLLSPDIRLYTEMITTSAILHGHAERLLAYHPAEHPLAVQLAGNEPAALAKCAALAAKMGYDEININVGCPSKRAQAGGFGACLMTKPEQLASCVTAIRSCVDIPVTIKSRSGIDHNYNIERLYHFVDILSQNGCSTFIIHARHAWLKGLSPAENRSVPPLQYQSVYQLQKDFPRLHFILNGGITKKEEIEKHLQQVRGVMIGRAAVKNPWLLHQLNDDMQKNDIQGRIELVRRYLPYVAEQMLAGVPLRLFCRHLATIWHGIPKARHWRRALSDGIQQTPDDISVISHALKKMENINAC